ncbi:MAG: hypothetical protein ABI416_02655 [Ginsengibacter sp.]
MKKIIIALLFIAGSLGFTNVQAQEKSTAKKSATAKSTTIKSKDSTLVKKTGMKKDGTPDMRLKENKTTVKTTPAGPTKKDGTADMRYKANKAKATK